MLSLLIAIPLVTSGLVLVASDGKTAKKFALAGLGIAVFLTLFMARQFSLASSVFQFSEKYTWVSVIGLDYSVGVDGISLPLIGLNMLICWLIVFAYDANSNCANLFFALLLLANAGLTGALSATNVLLFTLFYELELIPAYLLIAIWGSKKKEYAATKFLIFTAVSGILILVGFLSLGWWAGEGMPNFDYQALKEIDLPIQVQSILLLILLAGFGIKTPLVPFHSWLPDTYVESSTSTAMFLGGLLAKLGAYGLLRFCMPLFPEAWENLSPLFALWGGIGILYGAITAIAQKDIKRMVAYSSIGHMSYILLAIAADTSLSLVGAVSQMVSHGIILALLFYLVGIVEAKVGTREIDVLNGLMNPLRGLPTTSALLILGGMASAGIPGMMGFVAEFLIFQGSFNRFPVPTLMAIVGTGLTAVYFVILLNRTCFGRLDNYTAYYGKVTGLEKIPSLVLMALVLWLGIQPSYLVKWSESTATAYSSYPANTVVSMQLKE
ncbi:MAG: NADH-quinone oxidoreductase subunit M [Pseudanabaenaceae cyanobacterium]